MCFLINFLILPIKQEECKIKEEINIFVSIQLSKKDKEPLYVQLYDQLLTMIHTGRLGSGCKLPPVRKLARYLSINPGTIVNAYKELEKNGFIFSSAGSGSYVSSQTLRQHSAADYEFATDNIYMDEVLKPQKNSQAVNMSSISLNPDVISVEQLKKIFIEVLDRDQGRAFSYQDSQGFLPLRESIAANLRSINIHTSAKNLQIISGAQQGIDIVARALLKHGDYVFTESPTYPGAIASFLANGAKIIDIPLEQDGLDMNVLEKNLQQFHPKLIYLMPVLQNPSGCSYSLAKRDKIIKLAQKHNVIILEDDYISELSYRTKLLAPLKSIDRHDNVIYLKSLSKIFMPGLRLGFLTMPEYLAAKLLNVKYITDISTSGFTQRIFDLYLREGYWEKHIKDIRRIYKTQFEFAYKTARQYFPCDVTWHNPEGGLSFWLKLPERFKSKEFCRKAKENNLLITDGTNFYPQHMDTRHIRISFATLSLQEIETGMRILGAMFTK
ncbi:MocR-like pyridoxine biosynthesis transcription factor PdxR [Pectinatus sottacetonis]|uniref:MocR-like pyridoxine biosynthesis transcription factor PdxR n=1 Tax=Pectinatus sottacetonis TaxID=1002795 RepID=UPI002EDA105B